MNSLNIAEILGIKIADSVKKVAKRSVNLKIHIKRSLYARFSDHRLKTGGRNRNLTPGMDSLGSITYVWIPYLIL